MVGSQYKNIILWNLFFQKNYENFDSIAIAKDICKNLGVAFPHGDLTEIKTILDNETFLGWRKCNRENVERFANAGVASIGIDDENIFIILPNKDTPSLASFENESLLTSPFIKSLSEISTEGISFYVYSYGYEFANEEKNNASL